MAGCGPLSKPHTSNTYNQILTNKSTMFAFIPDQTKHAYTVEYSLVNRGLNTIIRKEKKMQKTNLAESGDEFPQLLNPSKKMGTS